MPAVHRNLLVLVILTAAVMVSCGPTDTEVREMVRAEVAKISLPAGEQGEAGPQGPQGQTGPQGPQGEPFDFAAVVAQSQIGVVKITSPESHGSGFFVKPNCSVVTARHVVEKDGSNVLHSKADVQLHTGQVVPFEVQYDIESKDVAVLRPMRSISCDELPMSEQSVRIDQAVAILGYPDLHTQSGFSAVPANVINTDPTGYATDFLMLGFSTYGTSGSAIVDGEGQVVGMSIGSYAVDWDDETGEWIHLNYLVAGTDVAKHLR